MGFWGSIPVAAAYAVDSLDHALGGNSDYATQAELASGDVGVTGDPAQVNDVAASENLQISQLPTDVATNAGDVVGAVTTAAGSIVNKGVSGLLSGLAVPWWGWVLGGTVLLGGGGYLVYRLTDPKVLSKLKLV